MKLKKRSRVDGVRNEVRAPGKPWGKYIYLGLVGAFLLWLFDLFLGEMFYFKASGLVVQDRVVLATQYDASVEALDVREGERVYAGETVALLRSQSVEENIAELASDVARMLEQASRLEVRKRVIEATQPLVERRVQAASAARREVEARKALFTRRDRLLRLQDELTSLQTRSTDVAEYEVISSDLPKIRQAIDAARQALERLTDNYAGGVLAAPVDGVVGYVHVSTGSVVNKATPMVELYTGAPYVLAYVPEGAMYELEAGDEVHVEVGFKGYAGVVQQIFPVSSALPKEYADALRVPQRAPLARIEFVDADRYPTLFAQTEVSTSGWPPRWMLRLLGMVQAAAPPSATEPTRALARAVPQISPQVTVLEAAAVPMQDAYTLQLISLPERTRVEQYASDLGLEHYRVLPVRTGGEVRYALLVGGFAEREAARKAAQALGHEAWIRPLSSLAG